MAGSNLLHNSATRLLALSGLGLLLTVSPVSAQGFGGGGSGGGGGGSGGGASGGGLTPFGGSSQNNPGAGAQSYQGGLFGGLGGNVQGVSSANPLQPYYANPYSIGKPQTGGKTGGTGSSGSSNLSGAGGTTNVKPSFGGPLFTTTNTGTGGGGTFGSSSSTYGAQGSSSFGGSKSGGSSFGSSSGMGSSLFGNQGSSGGLGSGQKFGSSGTGIGGSNQFGGKSSFGGTNVGGFGAGLLAGSQGSGANVIPSFSTAGMVKNNSYVAELGPTLPPLKVVPSGGPLTPGTFHYKLTQIIQTSSKLPSNANIQVSTQGQVVILNGTVADQHEKMLAEGMIRLTPGVDDVVNNLVVSGP